MRPISLHILTLVSLLAIFFIQTDGYHVSAENPRSLSSAYEIIDQSRRERRQVENFDEYPTAAGQVEEEDTGFWDRIVKVALKLFSRFVEWLNS